MKTTKKDFIESIMDSVLSGLYFTLKDEGKEKIKPGEIYNYRVHFTICTTKESAKVVNRTLNAWKKKYYSEL